MMICIKGNQTYKVLRESCKGGEGKWFLPKGGKPGKWMPAIEGEMIPFENGYHLYERDDLIHGLGSTLLSPTIYLAEWRGDGVRHGNKLVVREARLLRLTAWNTRTQRLFACDCAEHVESTPRNLEAIGVARRHAYGKANWGELDAARKVAADATPTWPAAWAEAVAGNATEAASCARSEAWAAAEYASWPAVRDVFRDEVGRAAGQVAGDAAKAAEGRWQTERLFWYLEGSDGNESSPHGS